MEVLKLNMELKDIKKSGVYTCNCPEKYYKRNDQFINWCRNWTFTVGKIVRDNSGKVVWATLFDTYFDDKCIEVDANNVQDFNFTMDRNLVREATRHECRLYDSHDVFAVKMDSSGEAKYFIKRDAKVSQEQLIQSLISDKEDTQHEIEMLNSKLTDICNDLSKAIDGTHYLLHR